MSYKPSDSLTVEFNTCSSTGALANADSTPTGTLSRNGTDDGSVTVTVTNKATGTYKAVCTIPSGYAAGDSVSLRVNATVGGVAAGVTVGPMVLDSKRLADKPAVALAATDVTGNVAADLQTIKTQTVAAAAGVTFPAIISSLTAANVWDYLASAATTVGSLGKRVVDYLGGGSKVAATVATGDDADAASNKASLADATNGLAAIKAGQTNGTTTLAAAYNPAKTAAQAGDAMALVTGAITSSKVAAGALAGKGDWNTLVPDNAGVAAIRLKTDNLPTSPAASGEAAAALDARNLTALNVAALLTDAGDAADGVFTTDDRATLGRIDGRTVLLTGPVRYAGPVDVAAGFALRLVQGDAYDAGARVPTWTFAAADYPDLTGYLAAKLRLSDAGTYVAGSTAPAQIEAGATIDFAGAEFTVSAPLSATQTLLLRTPPPADGTKPTHRYQLVATAADGRPVSLLVGTAFVTRRITPPVA